MSRIGKRIIEIPAGVTVTLNDGIVEIKGSKGSLVRAIKPEVSLTIEDNKLTLAPARETINARALWGTYGAHLANMIEGVTKGFQKKLIIEGVGYKMAAQGNKVVLDIGFSHPVDVPLPEGVTAVVEKNIMTINGFDKEIVGQFAATIRSWKKTEPYKGKGIRYEGEFIRRKQGKKTAA